MSRLILNHNPQKLIVLRKMAASNQRFDVYNTLQQRYNIEKQNGRDSLVTTYLPRPCDASLTFTRAPTQPIRAAPILCSNCGKPQDTEFEPSFWIFISMKCGHACCTQCYLLEMTGKEKCIVQGCNEAISIEKQKVLDDATRAWALQRARAACDVYTNPFSTKGIDAVYDKAVNFFSNEETAIKAYKQPCLVEIDIVSLRPHLVGFAHLIFYRSHFLGDKFDDARTAHLAKILQEVDWSLRHLTDSKQKLDGRGLLRILKKDLSRSIKLKQWPKKILGRSRATDAERNDMKLVLAFVIMLCQDAYRAGRQGKREMVRKAVMGIVGKMV